MSRTHTAGARFRAALAAERPLQAPGVINAYAALLAERAGFQALYLSGAGVANASFGLPDLGMTTMNEVLEEVRRITSATNLPLIVDVDTGWGGALMIARTIKQMIKAGAAGVQIEDQVQAKRCGHRPNKIVAPAGEMVDRIKAALDARTDPDFAVIARTDALAIEGLAPTIERARLYEQAGADLIFPEALPDLAHYRLFHEAVRLPILANMTEFGMTPLHTAADLALAGVDMAIYPISAFRAMSAAALRVYAAIRAEGSQESVLHTMQTREELYDILGYHAYEQHLDRLFQQDGEGTD